MADVQFKCEVCKVDAGSEANLVAHFAGVKHKKKLANLGKTQAQGTKTETNNTKRTLSNTSSVENNIVQKNLDNNAIRVRNVVTSSAPFQKMMEDLMKELQFPLHTMNEKYNRLCHDLEKVLANRFRDCRAYPFGSTITGLGFKTSDLDVYVDIKQNALPADLRNKTASDFTRLSRNILCKTTLFTKVIAIPNAKTPIVKCVHIPTGVQCDFNFKSMLGVCNSRLIKFLLASNRSFLGAMIIIKYWGRLHEISGTGKFTNYTLSMMFIFYLQVKHYLPSVYSLQLSNEFAFIQEGWNGGFCADPNQLPKIDTPIDVLIPEILHGFFKFYSTFDYGIYVISPLVGKPVAKSLFVDVKNLPNELLFYKQAASVPKEKPLKIISPICIQDPFVLIHNITSYISSKLLQEFQFLCENSLKAIETVKDTPNRVFYQILFTVPKPKVNNFEMCNFETCTFKIPYTLRILPTGSSDIKELTKVWCDNLHQFLVTVLSKVFLFNITAKKEYPPKKHLKTEAKTDVHNNDILDTTMFHCTGHLVTWEGRKNILKTFDAENKTEFLTSLQREIAISDYMLKVLYENEQASNPIVEFDMNYTTKTNPTEAVFSLHNGKLNKNHFKTMAHHLATLIPSWFEKHLKESNFINMHTEFKGESSGNIMKESHSKTATKTTASENSLPNTTASTIKSASKLLESIEKPSSTIKSANKLLEGIEKPSSTIKSANKLLEGIEKVQYKI